MFRFIDLFAGIGGFRLGLEAVRGRCIASSEINRQALSVYQKNWPLDPDTHNLGDICTITSLPQHELLVGGVPCQSWSIAGKNRGIEDPRGRLWNEVIRLVEGNRPPAFLFENVKGLYDKRHRESLNYLVDTFKSFGYNVYYKLLNAYDYGVPQNRDRIFIVGIQKKYEARPFQWPSPIETSQQLSDILDDIQSSNVPVVPIQRDLFGERIHVGFNKLTPRGSRNAFFLLTDLRNGPTTVHTWDYKDVSEREKSICMIMLKNRRKPKYGPVDGNPMSYNHLRDLMPDLEEKELVHLVDLKILRQYEDGKYEFYNRRLSSGLDGVSRIYLPSATFFPTIMASATLDFVANIDVDGDTDEQYKQNFIDEILLKKQYRPLKSIELARLQGYPAHFQRHEQESRNVKLFGNSVAVPVVEAVGRAIIKTGCLSRSINV